MVSVRSLQINDSPFLCVTLQLPGLTTQLIYCTHGILFDECWKIEAVGRRCRVPVCIGKGRTPEALLSNPVTELSAQAIKKGLLIGMSGQQALLAMSHEY